MKKLEKNLEWRRHIQKSYNEDERTDPRTSVVRNGQYYCARVPSVDRDDLIDYLSTKKIHTGVHFKPLHKHKVVKQDREYPVADREWKKLISTSLSSWNEPRRY